MKSTNLFGLLIPALFALAASLGCGRNDQAAQPAGQDGPAVVRLAYFPNVTHAQAVLGVSSGEFARAVEPAKLATRVFNAGPSLIEALFAGEVDIGYIGPGPALTGHTQSRGKGVRVIAGAAANGVLIVARPGSGITRMQDLAGRKIATPQLGNTQDISARHYLKSELKQTDLNMVLPFANAEHAVLMSRGDVDACWVPEPWGSRLIAEVGATLVAREEDLWPDKQFTLTLIITTPEFLSKHPRTVERFLSAHRAWTGRLQRDPRAYATQLGDALNQLTGKSLPKGVLESSLLHVRFTDEPLEKTLETFAQWSYELEFARQPVQLANLVDTAILRKLQAGAVAQPASAPTPATASPATEHQ